MPRTPPVTWEEMVKNPTEGGMRILANQIADRDETIARLRALNTELYNALDQAVTWLPSGFAPQSQGIAFRMADDAMAKYRAQVSGDRTDPATAQPVA